MSQLELEDVGKTVKIVIAKGPHHDNETGKITGRDSMPYAGSRCIWYVEARGYGEYYDERSLELV